MKFSYKNADSLRKYLTPQGMIVSRAKTGLRQKEQRQLARAVKRARHLAMLPFTQTV